MRKTVKQIQASYEFFWDGFDGVNSRYTVSGELKWALKGFLLPLEKAKNDQTKKSPLETSDLTFEAPKPELFSWWGQFSQVSQGRGGVLGV